MTEATAGARETIGPRSRVRLTAKAGVLLALMTALALSAVLPFRTYLEQRGRAAALERRVAALEEANRRLVLEEARLGDPAYLERVARECLGMVKPGEIAFVRVPEDGRGARNC